MTVKAERPMPTTKTYRVWNIGDNDLSVEATHFANRFEWVAEWYCDEHLQPGCDYDFGDTLTICVQCDGVTKRFAVKPEQEITYDIEEIEATTGLNPRLIQDANDQVEETT